HLGLAQAGGRAKLASCRDRGGDWIARHADLEAVRALAAAPRLPADHGTADGEGSALPPLGQRIAVARDTAFAFAYPALLEGWRAAGAEIRFFSPLADEAPAADADAVSLPGGYPELHAGRLTGHAACLDGPRGAPARGATVF